jgi:hypothetical protein
MRHIKESICATILLVLGGLALCVLRTDVRAGAQDTKKDKPPAEAKSRLDGAWRLVTTKDPATGEQRKLPEGAEMTKLIVGGRFVWTVVQDGKAVSGAGGTYALDDNSYTETVTFALSNDARGAEVLVGKSFKFTWTIEDGKWRHKGTIKLGNGDQEIDEVWERIP